jgi:hypothetical protein
VDVVTTDCGEPPCVAALTSTAPNALRALDACSRWGALYERYNAVPVSVRCDGARVKGWTISAGTAEDLGLVDPEDEANLKKRLRARREEIQRSWPCPDPQP